MALDYPYATHPEPGSTVELAEGVRWLTMPMGGSLNHINLYLIEDADGLVRGRHRLGDQRNQASLARDIRERVGGKDGQGRDLHPHAPGPRRPGGHDRQPLPLSALHDARRVLPGPFVHDDGHVRRQGADGWANSSTTATGCPWHQCGRCAMPGSPGQRRWAEPRWKTSRTPCPWAITGWRTATC